jgi:hypothetical protein
MKIEELLKINVSIKDQLNKAEKEIVTKVDDLQAKIDKLVANAANADLPEDVVQSITDLQASAKALDDLTPDVTPTPPIV